VVKALIAFAALALSGCGLVGAGPVKAPAKATNECPSEPPSSKPSPHEGDALETRVIARPCVYGVDANDRVSIEKQLRSRAGKRLDMASVADDVRDLMKTERFDHVEVSAIPSGHEVLVAFNLKERPRIGEVVFQGASILEKDGLPSQADVQKERYLSMGLVYDAMRLVRDEYHRRGYKRMSIDVSTELLSPKRARVKFVVVEGPQSKIGPISFAGNSKVSNAEVRKASHIDVGEPLDEEKINRAVVAIQELYLDRGMIQVQVEPVLGQPAPDGATSLTWNIVEGDVFRIGASKVGNLGAKSPSPKLKTKMGAPFSRTAIDDDVKTVIHAFAVRGQKVMVVPRRDIDLQKRTVDVAFDVTPAEP
jgi:outer membrane protein assembly factor BamA